MSSWTDIEKLIENNEDTDTCVGYYRILYGLVDLIGAENILEIGVHRGSSMLALFDGVLGDYTGVDITLEYLPNDIRLPNSVFIEGSSYDKNVIEQCRERGPFDFIFIDGDHRYDACRDDYENHVTMLHEDGIVVIHDVDVSSDFNGTKTFWNDLISNPNERFHFITYHNALPHTSNYSLGICLPHGLELL